MKIEIFEMERMQSTYENLVDYDMSESGIKPVSINDLIGMGFDLDAVLDMPLGYSQSDGTPELKELLQEIYPGAKLENIEVTNGTSEANYLIALSQLKEGDEFALEVPNYMQLWGVPRSLGAQVNSFSLRSEKEWEIDWEEFEKAVNPNTRLVYISNPNNPSGAVLSDEAMARIVEQCEKMNAYLIADEVYIGAEHDGQRTRSFWGMGDRVVVTSGLSKAYGIPGIRVGWIIGPEKLVYDCWSQHDYITIGPNKLSDQMTRVAVLRENREKLYARTTAILKENLPLFEEWVSEVEELDYTRSQAGAFSFLKLKTDAPSKDVVKSCLERRNTLIVPGAHFGMEGYIRVWLGGARDYLEEGWKRIAEELKEW
ncbi:MAG: aminotransferase class I/II-fold pyridoxal phosphate-dependent enzyme [Gemmatimonadetes bacterium]|jgi:aspartate/methionine/tyrosine aminotransferase|nr:aminotransferase class I/II-fold pyridoxal phosphate-dependent enzyme [Gemmatimonadota bacterium]